MNIQELTAENIDSILMEQTNPQSITNILSQKELNIPNWGRLEKEYNSLKHDIQIKQKKTVNGGNVHDKPSRIKLALQSLAVTRMSEMMFALPVTRNYRYVGSDDKKFNEVKNAIENIYKSLKIDCINLERSKKLFAGCEIATIMYVKEEQNSKYGFPSQYKLRLKTYSPMNDDVLYPLFDTYGDLIAFSIKYKRILIDGDEKKEISYFDSYTANNIYHIDYSKPMEEQLTIEKNPLGKIPVVYCYRQKPIWSDVSSSDGTGLIDEIEAKLSQNSDVISYNSAPVMKVKGMISGANVEDKGEARRIFQVSGDGDIAYVSWDQSVESLKFHIEKLMQMYFMQLQLPDVSFENLKALNVQSGEAMKMLLTDSHLKVRDESGIFLEFLDRESNVIKAFLKQANLEWSGILDEIVIENEIHPYAPNDEQTKLDNLFKANGGKPLMSQKESIEEYGHSSNVDATMEEISKEEEASSINQNRGMLFE